MTMVQDFQEALGEVVSFDPQILASYDHDLGEMPAPLMAMIRSTPEVVVAARSGADVSAALGLASRFSLPVTPRGQASSGYGGAIPSKGGLVLDLCAMNRVLAVDQVNATVDVEPGVIWADLDRALCRLGLASRVCPTSSPSSTVGGWFAMGGVGVGSLEYGSIRDSVLEIDVAGLDGAVTRVAGDDLDLHCQTCGILGVVTRLRLACRRDEPLIPVAVALPDAARAAAFVRGLEGRARVYSASLSSAGYAALCAEADGHAPAVGEGFLACLALYDEADRQGAAQAAEANGGRLLGDCLARAEWDRRFYPMRIKKLGPSVLVSEFYVPLERFGECHESVSRRLRRDVLGVEAFAVRGGRLAVLVYLLDDARSLLYPVRMAKAMIPLGVARSLGGGLYAPGMWFASRSREILGENRYEAVMRRKAQVDPRGLLNPGKIKGPGLPFVPLADLSGLLVAASNLAGPLAARLPYNRPRPGRRA